MGMRPCWGWSHVLIDPALAFLLIGMPTSIATPNDLSATPHWACKKSSMTIPQEVYLLRFPLVANIANSISKTFPPQWVLSGTSQYAFDRPTSNPRSGQKLKLGKPLRRGCQFAETSRCKTKKRMKRIKNCKTKWNEPGVKANKQRSWRAELFRMNPKCHSGNASASQKGKEKRNARNDELPNEPR